MFDSMLSWLGYFPHHYWHAGEEPERGSHEKRETPTLSRWVSRVAEMLQLVQENDAAQTPAVLGAAETVLLETTDLVAQWRQLKPR